jgi:hypothetical protein
VRALATLALALAACSPAGDDGLALVEPLVLSPTVELEAATREAAEAWTAATALPIVVGADGVRVHVVDDLENCGSTHTARRLRGELAWVDTIEIRRAVAQCGRWPRTMRHEVGHALLQHYSQDAPPPGDGHTGDGLGLMGANANATVTIDEGALGIVCSIAPCAWMAIEEAEQ